MHFCKKPASPANYSEFPSEQNRIAVLVVHGIGAQKPYTTLDHFARGIKCLFQPGTVQQQICFRQQTSLDNSVWTQAFVRLSPMHAATPERVIDVFEYYWAPVITGLVTPKQSLRFLLLSALTPFQYLRDNLNAIEKAELSGTSCTCTKVPPPPSGKRTWKRNTTETFLILWHELRRMLFIFLPLIGILLLLYWLIATPLLNLAAPANWLHANEACKNAQTYGCVFFKRWPLYWPDGFALLLLGLRLLFLFMSGVFLIEDFFPGKDRKTRVRSSWVYRTAMVLLFAVLLIAPLLQRHIPVRLEMFALVFATVLFVLLTLVSPAFRSAFSRAPASLCRHPLMVVAGVLIIGSFAAAWLPLFSLRPWAMTFFSFVGRIVLPTLDFLRWEKIGMFFALMVLLVFVKKFLSSAVGELSVYLGADELSKNFAARTRILGECTGALRDLLRDHADLAPVASLSTKYNRVVIAAHSLGSVITYDALNRLLVEHEATSPAKANPDFVRITGMLTFGCPLNKVFYFFRTRTSRSTTILERILFVLHPYRLEAPISNDANGPVSLPRPYPAKDPFGAKGGLRWLNAYSRFDLISGRMLFYCANQDIPVEQGIMPWTAHLSYWDNPDLYALFSKLLDDAPLT